MKAKDKATELNEKFGSQSINQINYTISIWKTKLKYAKEKRDKRGVDICLRTLKYWNNVNVHCIRIVAD